MSTKPEKESNLASLFSQAIAQGAKISVNVPNGYLDFGDRDTRVYACIGKYVGSIANLEFDLDDFIFTYAAHFPKFSFSISKNPPIKLEEKAAFFAYAHVLNPKLRECGDPDGMLDLKYLYYGLIEIFDVRNKIIHGAINLQETRDDFFKVRIQKYRRLSKGRYEIEEMIYTSTYLEKALEDTHYIRTCIWRAKEAIENSEALLKRRDSLMRGQAFFRELQEQFPEIGHV